MDHDDAAFGIVCYHWLELLIVDLLLILQCLSSFVPKIGRVPLPEF